MNLLGIAATASRGAVDVVHQVSAVENMAQQGSGGSAMTGGVTRLVGNRRPCVVLPLCSGDRSADSQRLLVAVAQHLGVALSREGEAASWVTAGAEICWRQVGTR